MLTRRRGTVAIALTAPFVLTAVALPSLAAAAPADEAGAVGVTQLVGVHANTIGRIRFEALPSTTPGPLPTSLDVRISHTSMLKTAMSPWDYPAALQQRDLDAQSSDKSLRFDATVARGQIVCASSRPRFADGVVGQWGPKRCTGRFLDDKALKRHGMTRRIANKHLWGGHASEVARNGTLTLRHVPRGSHIVTLATQVASNGECTCADLLFPRARGTGHLQVGSAFSKKTYFSQEVPWSIRTGRRGAIVFRPTGAGRTPSKESSYTPRGPCLDSRLTPRVRISSSGPSSISTASPATRRPFEATRRPFPATRRSFRATHPEAVSGVTDGAVALQVTIVAPW